MSPEVQARRLLKLADFLEEVPREKFDFGSWHTSHPCGTTACALGWAGLMPAFRKLGFKTRPAKPAGEPCPLPFEKEGQTYSAYAFSAALFGLDWFEHVELFVSQNEPSRTPKQVARKIRRFVKAKEGAK